MRLRTNLWAGCPANPRSRLAATLALLATVLAIAAGCSQNPEPTKNAKAPAPPPPPATKSDGQTVVDGLTGKTAVDAGQRARAIIDNVKTQEHAAVREAENF